MTIRLRLITNRQRLKIVLVLMIKERDNLPAKLEAISANLNKLTLMLDKLQIAQENAVPASAIGATNCKGDPNGENNQKVKLHCSKWIEEQGLGKETLFRYNCR